LIDLKLRGSLPESSWGAAVFRRVFSLAGVFAGLFAASATAAPIEAYGRLPAIEDVAISPDGARLGLIVTDGTERKVAVRELATGATQVLDSQGAKLRGVRWADNDHLLIQASGASSETNLYFEPGDLSHLYDYSVSSRSFRFLLRDTESAVLFSLPSVRTVDGETTLLMDHLMFGDNGARIGLWRIGLKLGFARAFKEGFPGTDGWLVGQDGQPLAETEFAAQSRRWTLKVLRNGVWDQVVSRIAPIDRPWLAGLSADGRSPLIEERSEGQAVFSQVLMDSGEVKPVGAPGPGARPVLDPRTDVLLGFVSTSAAQIDYAMASPRDQAIWRAAQAAYPGDRVEVVSWNDSHRKLVVRVDSPTTGPAYALVDFDAKTSKWIGDLYPELKAADIAPRKPFSYATRDGLQLGGFLTAAKPGAPVVVLLHDGLNERDEPGFEWMAQGLASRGYAVLQINYPGTAGLGGDLYRAGYGRWSRWKDDVADGLAAVKAAGLADGGRACVVGVGVGAYAAVTAGGVRCAAAVGGVTDPAAHLAWLSSRRSPATYRAWGRSVGAEDPAGVRIKAPAPTPVAGSAPLLLLHGTEDTVVAPEQSERLAKAFLAAGRPAEFISLKDEDHWLSRGETRKAALTALVAFLEKHNPPN